MIGKRDFSTTLNFQIESPKTGLKKLSFTNIFPESFYLSPYEWELGLVKLITPRSRMIPFPKLAFTLSTSAFKAGDEQSGWGHTFKFDIAEQAFYSIEDYIDYLNEYTKTEVNNRKLFAEKSTIEFEFSIKNNKINISKLLIRNMDPELVQTSQITMTDSENWRQLGFLQLNENKNYFTLPIEALSIHAIGSKSTILTLSAPNLIEPQLVGDTYKSVLELIPYDFSKRDRIVEFAPKNILYKRIIGGYISEIDLELEDLDNQDISTLKPDYFQVVLHFRPCQASTKIR